MGLSAHRSAFGVRRSTFGHGMVHAWPIEVVAKTFEDLEAWLIADELKREVYALIATGPASKDFKFCNQIHESAASSTRNIAEGFGRFRPGPFALILFRLSEDPQGRVATWGAHDSSAGMRR
jgi:hypothetical protein